VTFPPAGLDAVVGGSDVDGGGKRDDADVIRVEPPTLEELSSENENDDSDVVRRKLELAREGDDVTEAYDVHFDVVRPELATLPESVERDVGGRTSGVIASPPGPEVTLG